MGMFLYSHLYFIYSLMPDYLEQISQQELHSKLQSNLNFKGIVTFDNQKKAAIEIESVGTHDIIRDQIGSYGIISFSDSMPLWINNPVLIDNEEAQNYILDEDVANFISTTGTINSLVEASKIKATARFYKSGRFSPKVYSSGWKGGSRARIKTYKITSLAEKFSSKILIVGVLFDYGRAYYGQISCEKATVNSLVSVAAFSIGGWIGLTIGLVYWGLDSLGVFDRPNISNPSKYDVMTQPLDNLRVCIPTPPVPQQIIKRQYTPKQTFIGPAPAKRY